MARKPRPAVEDVESEDVSAADEAGGRMVRSEHRADMDALKAFTNRLAELPPGRRRELPLGDDAREALEQLAASGPTPARRRALMRCKLLLAHEDLDALTAEVEGRGARALAGQVAEHWRDQLLAGDDTTLQGFLAAHPSGDRQALRGAMREARGAPPAAARAERRLFELVRAATGG